jgi:hypothetical protein
MISYTQADNYKYSGAIFCHHFHDNENEGTFSSDIFVTIYQTTRNHIPEDGHIRLLC